MVFNTDYCLMQVKSIAEHSAILLTFIKLPFVIKIFCVSIFEWQLKTCFTVFSVNNIVYFSSCYCTKQYNAKAEDQHDLKTSIYDMPLKRLFLSAQLSSQSTQMSFAGKMN